MVDASTRQMAGMAGGRSAAACRGLGVSALVLAVCLGAAGAAVPAGEQAFARTPTWSIPAAATVRDRVERWIADSASPAADEPMAAAEARGWDDVVAGRGDLLDAVMADVALREPRAAAMLAAASHGAEPEAAWLNEPATDAFVRDAVALWWGRELVRHDRFDEALPVLERIDVDSAVDPAAVLFLRAACEHWLLRIDAATATLDRLLEREDEIPVRYARLARLLRADAAAVTDDSLDHVARRMRDVTRRLAHGRAGAATIAVQEGVVASLDRLIDQLEKPDDENQGGGAAGGGGGAGQGGAGSPMDDSRIARGRGPGEVRPRDLAPGESWGKLPPHERDRALQQIGREFPPHYREAIEEYFKRLATGAEDR
ncbi:MAG: hypothetical protein ACKO4T_13980 [Planctomycetaceae bacterium]